MGWLVGTSSHGLRAEVRAVGFDEEPFQGDLRGGGAQRVEGLVRKGDHAGERDVQSKLEKGRRVLNGSGEGVKDPLDRTSQLPELVDDVGLAVAAVNDHGKPAVMGQAQVAVEPFLLLGKWSAVPVSIQTGFTERDNPGPGRQLDDAGPIT